MELPPGYEVHSITSDDTEEMEKLQEYLSTEFEMKDLGGLKYFLGIEVARSHDGIYLSQRKYVLDLLSETRMLACKPIKTPIIQKHQLSIYLDQVPANRERYQSEDHMAAIMQILSYLKGAAGNGLIFKEHGHLEVKRYTDADWARNITDRRSTSGYFIFVGGNLATWRSKKQNVVARSTAKVEYCGMAHGIDELLELTPQNLAAFVIEIARFQLSHTRDDTDTCHRHYYEDL
ncbi:uncharacterized mitochondrial protein AtMg00810-like [Malus domestica]|uniref:uncharacterized mitochondrial protein AtMg00810-like n=1 Tax=Malus domestica TaxID=3750 RepID=UPI00397490CD